MLNVTPGQRPETDAGYLEMMTGIIFVSGLSRQVVMGKWDGFLDAFEKFDLDAVSDFTDVDVERLSQDTRIVRYKAKIRAPGYPHLAAMDHLARGHQLADCSAIIGSLDVVFGEIDR